MCLEKKSYVFFDVALFFVVDFFFQKFYTLLNIPLLKKEMGKKIEIIKNLPCFYTCFNQVEI
jgi:hypothetical protein